MASRRIVDRRAAPSKRSLPNKRRFIKRVEDQIKKAIPDVVGNNGIEDFVKNKGKVKVPIKGIKEPSIIYNNKTGDKNIIHPGNKEFTTGDKIKKPKGGDGNGRKGSKDAENSEDEFTISISKDEFMEYFFNDLELPDMIKKQLGSMTEFKYKRTGFTNDGVPSRLNVVNSYKGAVARQLGMAGSYDRKIKEVEEEIENTTDSDILLELNLRLDKYKSLKALIPYMNDVDLKYNNFEKTPIPVLSAAMFCIMDVSGSMGEEEKDLAKRYFILLYLFLTKNYEKIDLVYIRHTTTAKEVDEEEFFNSRETGGTIVEPALQLMNELIDERYSKDTNIYGCQISDGDVWGTADADTCYNILYNTILPKVQYFVYVETLRDGMGDLWHNYSKLATEKENFNVGQINGVSEVWKVFKDIFKKV